MKFTKNNGRYVATRKDGQVITIEKTDYTEKHLAWVARYQDDWDGDNTAFAVTKKELVTMENDLEMRI